MWRLPLTLTFVLTAFQGSADPGAPSFDCAKASREDERLFALTQFSVRSTVPLIRRIATRVVGSGLTRPRSSICDRSRP